MLHYLNTLQGKFDHSILMAELLKPLNNVLLVYKAVRKLNIFIYLCTQQIQSCPVAVTFYNKYVNFKEHLFARSWTNFSRTTGHFKIGSPSVLPFMFS